MGIVCYSNPIVAWVVRTVSDLLAIWLIIWELILVVGIYHSYHRNTVLGKNTKRRTTNRWTAASSLMRSVLGLNTGGA